MPLSALILKKLLRLNSIFGANAMQRCNSVGGSDFFQPQVMEPWVHYHKYPIVAIAGGRVPVNYSWLFGCCHIIVL